MNNRLDPGSTKWPSNPSGRVLPHPAHSTPPPTISVSFSAFCQFVFLSFFFKSPSGFHSSVICSSLSILYSSLPPSHSLSLPLLSLCFNQLYFTGAPAQTTTTPGISASSLKVYRQDIKARERSELGTAVEEDSMFCY